MKPALAGWLVLAMGAACGDSTGPPPVASVTITPDSAVVLIFDSVQLQAVARDAGGQPLSVPITWASSFPLAIPVNAAGRVTAYSRGTTSIVASAGGHSDTARVRVSAPATQLSVTPSTWAGAVNDSLQLTISVVAADGAGPTDTLRLTSSDTTVATVSATGRVRLKAPGGALIVAAINTLRDTVRVTAVTTAARIARAQP